MGKKALFLHGFGESSLLAGMSTKDLKDSLSTGSYELLPVPDAFSKLGKADCEAIADVEYRKMVEAGDLEAFAWYPFRKSTPASTGGHRAKPYEDFGYRLTQSEVDASCKKLVEYINKLGGVDVICGFSQGGELAYLFMEYLAKPGNSAAWADQIKFVATFGSEDPFNQRGVPPTAIKSDTSFFICLGEKDPDAVHDSKTAKAALEKAGARKVVVNECKGLDHHMPKTAEAAGKAAYTLMMTELAAAFVAPAAPAVDVSDSPAPATGSDGKSMRAIDNLMNDPNVKKFTWTIPPEAPPGWGMGNGDAYLIEHCGLYRPEHPKWKEMHPEGVEQYWKDQKAKE